MHTVGQNQAFGASQSFLGTPRACLLGPSEPSGVFWGLLIARHCGLGGGTLIWHNFDSSEKCQIKVPPPSPNLNRKALRTWQKHPYLAQFRQLKVQEKGAPAKSESFFGALRIAVGFSTLDNYEGLDKTPRATCVGAALKRRLCCKVGTFPGDYLCEQQLRHYSRIRVRSQELALCCG